MKNTWKTILVCTWILCLALSGCGFSSEKQEEAPITFADGITVKGTVISVKDMEINPAERNENITSIAGCQWMGPEQIAIEAVLNGNEKNHYFTIYSLAKKTYVYEQFGQMFVWQDDNPDSLIYVQNYAESGGTSQVKNKNDVVLYTTGNDEQITGIAYVPKGIRIDVADNKGNLLRSVVVEVLSDKAMGSQQ